MKLFDTLGDILRPENGVNTNPYLDMVKQYKSKPIKKGRLTRLLNQKEETLHDAETFQENGAKYYFNKEIRKAIFDLTTEIDLIKKAYEAIK